MVDQMISCLLCRGRKESSAIAGTFSNEIRAISGTPYSFSPYRESRNRESRESRCSLCQGTGFIDKETYDVLCKNMEKVAPKRPSLIINKPTRIIDLDDDGKGV